MKKYLLLLVLCLGLATGTAFAQALSTKGSIGGRVADPGGASVPGAKVTVVGQTGTPIESVTNGEGYFEVRNLDPGNYTLTVEQTGFKKTTIQKVEVVVGQQNTITANLQIGETTAEVIVTDVAQIDQNSTAVGSNLNDQLYQNIPVQRSVQSLFYLSAGVSDSLQGGNANPSISGGSALDNLYVADGVNITDSAFGGLGVFSRVYGTLGTGINTSYIKEVQVKTGGFEPQYGQSTGGIVNIITKSGGNEFHGAIYGYARPNAFEATRRKRDDFSVNKFGASPPSASQIAQEQYDTGVDFSGYIPGARDHLFFFSSFNPSIVRDIVEGAHRNAFEIANGTGADSGLFKILGVHVQRYRTLNYAFKLDYNINASHTINFSIFGDPTRTNLSSFSTLNIDNTTALSQLDYGTRNISARYNGAFGASNPLTVSATLSRGKTHFDETGYADLNQIIDRTQASRGNFTAVGLGFTEPIKGRTDRFTLDLSKQVSFWGTHTIGVGYTFQHGLYSGVSLRSGPKFTVPATNATGVPLADFAAAPPGIEPVGQTTDAAFSLRLAASSCTLCPLLDIPGVGLQRVYLRQDRGSLGSTAFDTFSRYHSVYAQDTWRINRFVTVLLGLRNEQERLSGNPNKATGQTVAYSFTGQWAPRIGVTFDPTGRGTMKVYYNFGRFFEFIPLDLAQRSLSSGAGFMGGRFAPEFVPCTVNGAPDRCAVVNQYGTVNPVYDAAHLLTAAAGGTGTGISVSAQSATAILPGTKLGYTDEHLVGFEKQLPGNFVLSARYLDRRWKRIVEDAAVQSPEQGIAGLFGQAYFIGNIASSLDAAINPIPHLFATGAAIPAACVDTAGVVDGHPGSVPFLITGVTDYLGNVLGNVCYEPDPLAGTPGSDGIPDGFPDPVHIYRSVEVEVNKRFSDNWQLLSNVRFSSLRGNYEGHFRNDNVQTDPGISSLFDFTAGQFGLLGDQFAVGPLNGDRRVVANIYGSYTLHKEGFGSRFAGLTLGANLHGESGVPVSEFIAHPVYLNAGEMPLGGRGKVGRTSPYYRLDLHIDYPWAITETKRLSFIVDFFNVTNNRPIRQVNEYRESTAGQLNPDYLAPRNFYPPFNMRVGMRFEF